MPGNVGNVWQCLQFDQPQLNRKFWPTKFHPQFWSNQTTRSQQSGTAQFAPTSIQHQFSSHANKTFSFQLFFKISCRTRQSVNAHCAAVSYSFHATRPVSATSCFACYTRAAYVNCRALNKALKSRESCKSQHSSSTLLAFELLCTGWQFFDNLLH